MKPTNVFRPNEAILVMYGLDIRNGNKSNVTVWAGPTPVHVSDAGAAPVYSGEDRVNIVLSASLAAAGDLPISLEAVSSICRRIRRKSATALGILFSISAEAILCALSQLVDFSGWRSCLRSAAFVPK